MPRTTGVWLSYLRISIGVMWLFELVLGRWWKLGVTAGLHPGWFGPEAGAEITLLGERAIADGAFPWVQWLLETVVLPNAAGWSLFVVGLEILIALSFIFGLFTRFFALWAVGLSFVILNLGTARIQPLFAMAHIVLLWSGGGAIGLDQVLLRRLADVRSGAARLVAGAIRFRILPHRALPVVASVAVLAALYHALQVTQLEAARIQLASLELAVLFGLVGMGLFAVERGRDDPTLVPIELVRIFVGFKLVHEIFVRTEAGINGLPGWAPPEVLARTFEEIVLHHAAFVAGFVEAVVLPYLPQWAFGLAAIQTAAGILLILGWRSRTGATLGLGLTGLLVALGFVRLAPFMLIYLVFLAGTGSGRLLAVDAHGGIRSPRTFAPLPLGRRLTAPLAAVAFVLLVFAGLSTLETDGYLETMAGFSAFLLALPAAVLAVVGWLDRKPVEAVEPRGTPLDARTAAESPPASPAVTAFHDLEERI